MPYNSLDTESLWLYDLEREQTMTTMQRYARGSRAPKDERLEARVTRQLKDTIQRAADLLGLSVTDFVAMSAQQAAEAAIREHSLITLTARDSEMFAEALLNPRKPSEKLRAAFERHDEDVISVELGR